MYMPYKILSEHKDNPEDLKLPFNFSEEEYFLIPAQVTEKNIELLAKWREDYWDAFPAKFKVTLEGTKTWLINQVINNEDRILFMIIKDDNILGHLGFFRFDLQNNTCEIDNVVKGADGFPGLMTAALSALTNFAFEVLKLSGLYLRVFSDNEKAIRLYERCGFIEVEKIPLKRTGNDDEFAWNEIDDASQAERYFSKMFLKGIKND